MDYERIGSMIVMRMKCELFECDQVGRPHESL